MHLGVVGSFVREPLNPELNPQQTVNTTTIQSKQKALVVESPLAALHTDMSAEE